MANPGDYVSTQSGWKNNTGYTEPKAVCWQKSEKSGTRHPEPSTTPGLSLEGKNPDPAKALDSFSLDVNGDSLPDRFQLVEESDRYVLLLNRGVIYTNSWEGCGGGGVTSYYGLEEKGHIVGELSKAEIGNFTATAIGFNILVKNGRPNFHIYIEGKKKEEDVRLGFSEIGAQWVFEKTDCPKPTPDLYKRPSTSYGRFF